MLVTILASAAIAAAGSLSRAPDPARGLGKRECIERGGAWARACIGPLQGKPLPMTSEIEAAITTALIQKFGEGAAIRDATRELRDEGEVVCGFHKESSNDEFAHLFFWMKDELYIASLDGRRSRAGAESAWSAGSACLNSNYHPPIP